MQMEIGYVFTVVITGLVVVFVGLALLIAFVYGIGKIFDSLKKSAEQKAAAAAPVKTEPAVKFAPAPVVNPVPVVEDGISDEVVAVISAAVAAMSSDYKLTGIKKSSAKAKSSRRTAWGNKGVSESTSAF